MGFNKIKKSSQIARIVLSFFVLLFFSTLALAVNPDLPPVSILVQSENNAINSSYRLNKILKGEKVKGSFKAKFSNLGIIGIRFYNFKKINKDSVLFRLKEQGASSWAYENTYKVDQFQPNDYFTFGFPVMKNSIDKVYEFEIESVSGTKKDAIAVHKTDPVLQARYQFSLLDMTKRPIELGTFLVLKFMNVYINQSTVMYTFLYLLPFVIFIINLATKKRTVKLTSWILLFTILFIVETFFLQSKVRVVRYLILSGYWVYICFDQKLEARFTFLLVLFIFPFMAIFTILSQSFFAEQIAIWIYYLLVIGLLQIGREKIFRPIKLIKVTSVLPLRIK